MSEPNSSVNADTGATSGAAKPMSDEEFVRLVADRVWEMLKRDLRIERERGGYFHSGHQLKGQ